MTERCQIELVHRSKQGCYSITSSARARSFTTRKREFSAIRLILMKPDLFIVADSLTCVDYNFLR